ncbi:Deoxyguanosinetriphosphate triphosphohydrolase-like protein [Gossypium arboreum]|uniref:Deoxyguanosinetriphosphate triphosphohydrolase-like protein n=1 Tax=Gossypium arboreum TaxID=29729 RepID=A0A0B0NJC8_GOSAR|nr:Deoxyguanosinetriphosphate triphosphohydrolase-like protein [Gossypium arboreum]
MTCGLMRSLIRPYLGYGISISMSYHVRPYSGYEVDTIFRVRPRLGHGVKMRIRIRSYLGHGIGILLCMVILSILSIPSGSMGSPRMCPSNDDYRQVSSGIKGCQRLVHTIDWIFLV